MTHWARLHTASKEQEVLLALEAEGGTLQDAKEFVRKTQGFVVESVQMHHSRTRDVL